MEKPTPHIIYATTDTRKFTDPVDAANHELTVQVENFIEAFLGDGLSFSRGEITELLRGKRHELAKLLTFDYLPERVTIAKAAPPAPAPAYAPPQQPAPPMPSSFGLPRAQTPFPTQDGGMSDDELLRAIGSNN